MKKINALIPAAMNALRASDLILADRVSILKEYDGYVASFSPSLITAGLKATLSFYSDQYKAQDDLKKPRRHHILQLLLAIYQAKYPTGGLPGDDLLNMAIETNTTAERQLKKDLMDAATALKLAMRNFRQADDERDLLKPTNDAP